MYTFLRFVFLFLFSSIVLAHAQTPAKVQGNKPFLNIVVSFSVLGDIVKNICGEHGNVTTLVGPNSDAHVYEPTPRDAQLLHKADMIFINGLSFEGWMDRLISAAESTGPVIVCTKGITPLPSSKTDLTPDPHTWNDLSNALIYVDNIVAALKTHDPEHTTDYDKNAQEYKKKIKDLDKWATDLLRTLPDDKRKVITVHDAFNYFGKHFNIAFRSPVGVDTKAEPSARTIALLIEQIKAENITALFVENITNPHLIEQISQETGVALGGTLYSDALSEPDGPAPSYLAMIKHNITQLVEAMKKGGKR